MKESAAADGLRSGAQITYEAGQLPQNDTDFSSARKAPRSIMASYAKPAHKAAARMLGFALVASTVEAWRGLATVLTLRLTLAERGALAFAALRSLDPDARAEACEFAFFDEPERAGAPMPPFLNTPEDEAENWSAFADRRELKAYARACLSRLHPRDRERLMSDLRANSARAAA